MKQGKLYPIYHYLRKKRVTLILGLFIALAGGLFIVFDLAGNGTGGIAAGIFILFLAGLVLLTYLIPEMELRKRIRELEAEPEADLLLKDFLEGEVLENDRVRLGSSYVIGKAAKMPFLLADIEEVYLASHRVNGMEDRKELRVVYQGDVYVLCRLSVGTRGEAQAKEIKEKIFET